MARRATAQDVADLAGVSRSAVSLVLNGRGAGNIAVHKQHAIIDAARQLNYTPNAVALSLRNQRTRTIGVLTWPGDAGVPLSLLGAVYNASAAAGYLLLTVNVERQADLVDTLLDRQVDALLVVAPSLVDFHPPESLLTVPSLLVNCHDPARELTALVPDEIGAGAAAARQLIAAGHTRIGVVAHATSTVQAERRLRGVHDAMAAAGLDEPLVAATGRDMEAGYTATKDLLAQHPRPTGLVVTHERLVVGALLAAAHLGLTVPEDLSLVSLDDGEGLAGHLVPALELVQRPDRAIADHALDLLMARLRGSIVEPPRELTFVCPVQTGASVAEPPETSWQVAQA